MTTAALMRTTSGPVQPHTTHGGRPAGTCLFGWSRGGGSLSSPAAAHRSFGRRVAASLERAQSEGKAALGEEDQESAVHERKALGLRVVELADGDKGSGGRGRGRGGARVGRDGAGEGDGQSEMGAYYQEMLEADPGNALLLRNYGKFLHEVEGDVEGAEECYGRAILASPGDGEVLSLYGKLIWDAERDENRAESYFERAVEASPDDCYVLGSYAHFLWDAEEEEEIINWSSSTASPSLKQQQHHMVRNKVKEPL